MNAKNDLILYQIKVEGFVFFELKMPQGLIEKILRLNFEYHPTDPGEDVNWAIPHLPVHIENEIKDWLKRSEDLKNLVDDLVFDAHTLKKGDFLKIHNDAKDKGDYQILLWVCENDRFEGRDFLYGIEFDGNHHVKSRKVSTGLVCVMDINNKNFVHGVSELKSDTKIITVQGFHPS